MYNSTKKEDGTYTKRAFLKRGFQLVKPSYFFEVFDKYFETERPINRFCAMLDYYGCLLKYGAIVPDYFEYKFFEKSDYLRKQFLTMKDNKRIKKIFNNEPRGIFRNKMLFNELFADFRNLHTFTFDKSYEEFTTFVKLCNGEIIAKPYTGFSGGGIFKPNVQTEEEMKQTYENLKKDGQFFCEEVFLQTGILNKVNPQSVNTIRMYTVFDGEQIHITAALVRFGGGKACVDNIHSGGMCCEVDLETGIVVGDGYNLSGDRFFKHPVTGVILPGIQIPMWDKVVDMVKEASLKYLEQGHIAWDIAVSEDRVSIIEGNDGGNFDVPQVGMQRGLRREYEQLIEKRRLSGYGKNSAKR